MTAGSDRWTSLFDDLEARLDAASSADLAAEVAERTRLERSRVPLENRLRAALRAAAGVTVRVEGAGLVTGRLEDAGPDWLLLGEQGSREVLVPLRSVLSVTGAGRQASAESRAGRRLDLRWALRGLARDRSAVALVLRDGTTLSGTVDAVGEDALDLAVHAPGEARRRSEVSEVALVPLAAVALLRRR